MPKNMKCFLCGITRTTGTERIHLYGFPKDEELRKDWVLFCSSHGLMVEEDYRYITETTVLCSSHFRLEDFKSAKKRYLKKNAVPCIYFHDEETEFIEERIPKKSKNRLKPTPDLPSDLPFSEEISIEASTNFVLNEVCSQINLGSDTLPDHIEKDISCTDQEAGLDNKMVFEEYGIEVHSNNDSDIRKTCSVYQECSSKGNGKKFNFLRDFTEEDMNDPDRARRFRELSFKNLQDKDKRIKILKQKVIRLKSTLSSIKASLKKEDDDFFWD